MKKILSVILAITLTLTLAQGFCVMAAEDVQTAYGTIPAEYADASAYPIAVFFSDKTFWHAGADWTTAMSKAIDISGYGYRADILIRNDITITGDFNNMSYITNGLIIDLDGHNLTLSSYLAQFDNRSESNYTVKNGSFTITDKAVFDNMNYYAVDYANPKSFTFENITFTYGSGATITTPRN